MSNSVRYVGLERAETAVYVGPAGRLARRKAVLLEEIAAAFAEGDAEMVSRLRGELALLEAGEAEVG